MDDEQLTLRKMAFDGIPYDDDWLAMWRGLNAGRILKQSAVTVGVPGWFWGINMTGIPQPAHAVLNWRWQSVSPAPIQDGVGDRPRRAE